jgi:hypothetical protein
VLDGHNSQIVWHALCSVQPHVGLSSALAARKCFVFPIEPCSLPACRFS